MQEINAYRKSYKFRLAQGNKVKTIEVTFPYEVIEKESRKYNLTISEFISQYNAIAQYDGFDGVVYTFEKVNNG